MPDFQSENQWFPSAIFSKLIGYQADRKRDGCSAHCSFGVLLRPSALCCARDKLTPSPSRYLPATQIWQRNCVRQTHGVLSSPPDCQRNPAAPRRCTCGAWVGIREGVDRIMACMLSHNGPAVQPPRRESRSAFAYLSSSPPTVLCDIPRSRQRRVPARHWPFFSWCCTSC